MKQSRVWAWIVLALLLNVLLLQAQQSDSAGSTSGPAVAPTSSSSQASAGTVPRLVQFNGVITDPTGKAASGTVTATFSLYVLQEGGTPLWSETQSLPLDSQGRYTAFLGAASPDGLPLDLFASGSARWLGIAPALPGVGEQPRVLLVGVPYALKAADADTLGGLPASAFMQTGQSAGSAGSVGAPSPSPAGGALRGGPSDSAGQAQSAKGISAQSETPVANYLPYWNGVSNLGNSVLFQSGSNLGIGTTAPLWNFHLVATSSTKAVLNVAENNATTGTSLAGFTALGAAGAVNNQFYADGLGTGPLGTPGGYIGTYSNHPFALFTNNTERVRVTTGGWVGVGTTNPLYNFHLVATSSTKALLNVAENNATTGTSLAGFTALGAAGAVNNQFYADGLGTGPLGTPGGYIGTYTNHPVAFFTNNVERLRVTASGRVGIGTSNPAVTLEVNGTSKFDQAVTFPSGLSISNTGLITFAAGQTLPAVSGEIIATNSAGQAASFTSNNEGSSGLSASGGSGSSGLGGGTGAIVNGGNETGSTGNGGVGLQANGGTGAFNYVGGVGIQANGGSAVGSGGAGIVAKGGYGFNSCCGGAGVDATGAIGFGIGIVGNGGGAYNADLSGGVGVLGMGGVGGSNGVDGTGVFANGGNSTAGERAGDGIDAAPGYGGSGSPYAGSFNGNVTVMGTLTSTVKDFLIDHPLDPANKYLYHSSVESSEMMNMYTGNATLDASGQATVQLPAWFQSENADFRYQLTAIGAPAPGLYIAQEVHNSSFAIAGGQAGMKVSWQVTAVRQDAYAKAHPLAVEVDKPREERGYFIHPELYGAPAEKSIDWARHPELMKLIKEKREKQAKETRAMRAQSAAHAR
jgi:hypothetical protein